MRETNGNFDSCNSCKRLGTSRLHELHESKFPFVSRIEFIRSKLSNFSAHVSGVTVSVTAHCSATVATVTSGPREPLARTRVEVGHPLVSCALDPYTGPLGVKGRQRYD